MKYFIYGSRHYSNYNAVAKFLDTELKNCTQLYTVVDQQEGCIGALVKKYAELHKIPCEALSSLYNRYGPDIEEALYRFCIDQSDRQIYFIRYNEYPMSCRPYVISSSRADALSRMTVKVLD